GIGRTGFDRDLVGGDEAQVESQRAATLAVGLDRALLVHQRRRTVIVAANAAALNGQLVGGVWAGLDQIVRIARNLPIPCAVRRSRELWKELGREVHPQ